MAQAHSIAMQLLQIRANGFPEETHQAINFRAGASPILGGKSIDAEHFDMFIGSTLYDTTQGSHARFVTSQARQMTFRRPAPVAIHNDGQVAQWTRRLLRRDGLWLLVPFSS